MMRRLMAGMILLSAVSFLGLRPAHAGLVGIYWGDISNLKVQRADLDGCGVTELVNDQIYLTTAKVGDSIQRANLDGSGVGNLVIGPNVPMEIALIVPPATVPEPSIAFLTIFGLLAAGDEPSIRRDSVSRLALVYSL